MLREEEEEEKKQGEKGSQENRNISCSQSPQAVPSRPSGKCRLKARTMLISKAGRVMKIGFWKYAEKQYSVRAEIGFWRAAL
jgi:hypothetical protein